MTRDDVLGLLRENMDRIINLSPELVGAMQRCHVRGVAAMTISELHRASVDLYTAYVEANLAAYREREDGWGIAWSLDRLGGIARYGPQRDDDKAKQLLEQSLAVFANIGDRWGATWPQALLGLMAEEEGRYADAYQLYATRLRTCEEVGDAGGVAWSLQQIAKAALELDDVEKARFYCRESLRVALDISSGNSTKEAILRIGSMYMRMGRLKRAVELLLVLLDSLEQSNRLRPRVEHLIETLKAQLSSEAFTRSAQNARQWTIKTLGWALLDELADQPRSRRLPDGIESLSERELDVLRLAAEGLSNREIAARLVVTVGTVKKHLNNIFGKLGVERRTQAIERAREWQLLP